MNLGVGDRVLYRRAAVEALDIFNRTKGDVAALCIEGDLVEFDEETGLGDVDVEGTIYQMVHYSPDLEHPRTFCAVGEWPGVELAGCGGCGVGG